MYFFQLDTGNDYYYYLLTHVKLQIEPHLQFKLQKILLDCFYQLCNIHDYL